jgi:DNA-binding PadR family transcriptional regulator
LEAQSDEDARAEMSATTPAQYVDAFFDFYARGSPDESTLTQTLRTLERDGLVARTLTPGVPARVDYALTPLGMSLMPAVNAVKVWAEQHITEIEGSRAAYDTRAAG